MDNLVKLQKEIVNHRFSMFIHFNSATFQFNTGEIVDWEYDHENGKEPRKFPFNPKDWNPTDLDCKQWAKAAKSAKVEFAALTTKHHEGFCIWPTQFTEHCIRNATLKTDVVKEYLEAFRAEGIKAGFYFSMLDLTHEINKNKCTAEDKQYIKNQLTELLTNYGEIPFIIVDGWQSSWGGPTYDKLPFEEIDALVKGLQPNCLLMNIGYVSDLKCTDVIFYENSAGQQVPKDFAGPGIGCQTLTGQWFWRETDPSSELKPASWALELIKSMNAANVTFIMNSTPNIFGKLDDNMVARYEEIGKLYTKVSDVDKLPDSWLTR